jgi:hypothetical protein
VTPLVRSRSQRIAALVAAGAAFAIGFVPLFGGPGYEHALACGLVLPSGAAIATAFDVARADARDDPPLHLVGRGVASGLALAAIGFATALLHGLRLGATRGALVAGFCDLWGGALDYALTAMIGAVMGGVWGVVAGEIAARTKRRCFGCVALAIAAPLAGVVISVGRFYTSPMIFAFDPFVGYFSGTLYDTVIDAGNALLTYRVGSLCTLVATALVASALERREDGRLGLVDLRASAGARACLALGACAAAGSLAITANGAKLGHWSTSASIAEALGGRRAGARCDVVYPDGLREDQIALLVRDCEEELAHDEAALGATYDGRITAFFFRDAGEKKRFMGAESTYIAKPWRREVYLQMHSYPHPVLGHEVAHVVAGSMARGPFRIAGGLGGWWPNPGLIEGVAVAASPDEDELTDAQWAHAMADLGILPPIGRVFSMGFLGESSAKSYTLAGAFVRWTRDKFGKDAVRRWYGGEDLAEIVHEPWGALDREWREAIESTPMSDAARAYAKAKFDRPAVFGRVCPHVIDAMRREADGCREALQVDKAVKAYDEVLARDPHDWAAEWGRGVVRLRYGQDEAQRALGLRELADMIEQTAAPVTWANRAKESMNDEDLARQGSPLINYEAIAASTVDEDVARTLDVKAYAAANGGEARVAIASLLVGEEGRPAEATVGLARVAAWAAETHDPVAEYVYGKNLVNHEEWRDAAIHLDLADETKEPTPRVARELLRQRAIARCVLGDIGKARDVRRRVEDPSGPFAGSVGRREWLLAFLDRCGAK